MMTSKTDQSKIRVRFAPSPTGFLHVGGARTALFNWLFARQQHGQFILRIEDTDAERSNSEMVAQILHGLSWLGIDWDEGPIFQSERLTLYRDAVAILLAKERAYPCFCDPEALARQRETSWNYSGTCRNISTDEARQRMAANEPYAVRLKLPAGETHFVDLVHGPITIQHEHLDDFVIQRRDGMPIYHLACVVDDAEMLISHVIRGADHLSNTPKQILLYQALEKPIPAFVHVPLIMGPDKKRLSKRHGATAVGAYEKDGFLPDAVRNFLALLGWSSGTEQEIFTRDGLIEAFSFAGLSKANAVFDIQKLEWLNGQYINQMRDSDLLPTIQHFLQTRGYLADDINNDWLLQFVALIKPRLKRIEDVTEFADYFFGEVNAYDPQAVKKHWKGDATERLTAIREELTALQDWTAAAIEDTVRQFAEKRGIGAGKVIHPIRVALTGRGNSPGLFEMMALMGRETVLTRLQRSTDWLAHSISG